MGSLRNPVGSLPSTVYWRRRVLVLLAVIAALALILYACSGSGSGKKKPVADGKSTSPAASQTSLASSGGSSTAAASGGASAASGGTSSNAPASSVGAPSGSAGSTGGPGGSTGGTGGTGGTTGGAGTGGATGGSNTGAAAGCQLSLLLTTQAAQYANGDQPAFTVTAFNKGTADCDVDFSPKSMVLNIYSGADRVWSSADCGAGAKDVRGIAPGSAQSVTYTWNRVRSATGCPAGTQTAKLGTYFGVVALAAGSGPTAPPAQSQPKTFELKSGS